MSKKPCSRAPRGPFAVLAAVTALAAAPIASASVIGIVGDGDNSTEGIASFSGTIAYDADIFTSTGLLTISLTNTSDAANGGYLTAFTFNIDSTDPGASASLQSSSHSFQGLSSPSAQPFGHFSAGASVGQNWEGGGSPHGGIGVGQTGLFEFSVSAADADLLTAQSFLFDNANGYSFAARFRGFDDGASDKVPGISIEHIPAPGAMALLLIAGLAGRRRRQA